MILMKIAVGLFIAGFILLVIDAIINERRELKGKGPSEVRFFRITSLALVSTSVIYLWMAILI